MSRRLTLLSSSPFSMRPAMTDIGKNVYEHGWTRCVDGGILVRLESLATCRLESRRYAAGKCCPMRAIVAEGNRTAAIFRSFPGALPSATMDAALQAGYFRDMPDLRRFIKSSISPASIGMLAIKST